MAPITYIYDYSNDYYIDCKDYYHAHGGTAIYP